MRAGKRTGGGQRGLLDKVVAGVVAVKRAAQEPLRLCRLCVIETRREKRVVKGDANGSRNRDRIDPGNQSLGRKLRECIELSLTIRAVGYACTFIDVFK